MSLASPSDYLFRPEDKALKMLFPSLEESSANDFDEYLNGEQYELSEQEDNELLSEALTEFLERKPSASDTAALSPIGVPARHEGYSPQPWREGLWCMNQNVPTLPEIKIAKTRSHIQPWKYDLRDRENAGKNALLSPKTPLATPPSTGTKRFVTSPKMTEAYRSPHARRTFSREVTLSPSPMYAQIQHKGGMVQPDTWQQDFKNFNLRLPEERLPLSPPFSGRITQHEMRGTNLDTAIRSQNAAAAQYHGHQAAYQGNSAGDAFYNSYAAVDPAVLNQFESSRGMPISKGGVLCSPPPLAQAYQGLPSWKTECLHASAELQYSSETNLHPTRHMEAQHWHSPSMIAYGSQHRYLQQYYSPTISAPIPRRPTHQLIQQTQPVKTVGLGINYPKSAGLSPSSTSANAAGMQSYPPLPPPPTYAFTNTDPFSTPGRLCRNISPLRSPSSSISPMNITRTLRQRSPTHHSSPTHNRRKSIHKLGPVSTTSSSSAIPKTPRTPKMPRTPTSNGIIDFVNFTPKDSKKLLSDVAPSGSSKTRARRDQEAKEKRKRLSEAAIKAIRRAGGDIRVLKAEGVCLT